MIEDQRGGGDRCLKIPRIPLLIDSRQLSFGAYLDDTLGVGNEVHESSPDP
jgi:hypothetical protein